ncbi:hypothetical protein HDU97_006752 [Phlyctochytrium planicorne]|nr:hypothetical protein HDU97_006752 [Phlyctochytrium planicorne]
MAAITISTIIDAVSARCWSITDTVIMISMVLLVVAMVTQDASIRRRARLAATVTSTTEIDQRPDGLSSTVEIVLDNNEKLENGEVSKEANLTSMKSLELLSEATTRSFSTLKKTETIIDKARTPNLSRVDPSVDIFADSGFQMAKPWASVRRQSSMNRQPSTKSAAHVTFEEEPRTEDTEQYTISFSSLVGVNTFKSYSSVSPYATPSRDITLKVENRRHRPPAAREDMMPTLVRGKLACPIDSIETSQAEGSVEKDTAKQKEKDSPASPSTNEDELPNYQALTPFDSKSKLIELPRSADGSVDLTTVIQAIKRPGNVPESSNSISSQLELLSSTFLIAYLAFNVPLVDVGIMLLSSGSLDKTFFCGIPVFPSSQTSSNQIVYEALIAGTIPTLAVSHFFVFTSMPIWKSIWLLPVLTVVQFFISILYVLANPNLRFFLKLGLGRMLASYGVVGLSAILSCALNETNMRESFLRKLVAIGKNGKVEVPMQFQMSHGETFTRLQKTIYDTFLVYQWPPSAEADFRRYHSRKHRIAFIFNLVLLTVSSASSLGVNSELTDKNPVIFERFYIVTCMVATFICSLSVFFMTRVYVFYGQLIAMLTCGTMILAAIYLTNMVYGASPNGVYALSYVNCTRVLINFLLVFGDSKYLRTWSTATFLVIVIILCVPLGYPWVSSSSELPKIILLSLAGFVRIRSSEVAIRESYMMEKAGLNGLGDLTPAPSKPLLPRKTQIKG